MPRCAMRYTLRIVLGRENLTSARVVMVSAVGA